ncbi:MAG: aconitate hydratase AcnA [Thermoleophilia bacterium]|nr:aconitate hydratase AcnA [Thermoleophilia bacterium]
MAGRETQKAGPFGAWTTLKLPEGAARIADLGALARATGRDLDRLPYSIRVLLENALHHCGTPTAMGRLCGQDGAAGPSGASRPAVVSETDLLAILDWDPASADRPEFAFMPARVLLQDFTGVPCVVDLAALRSAVARSGGDPSVIDPSVPVDLVIDHSVQVDYAGVSDACRRNMELEMERNGERYALLRWAQGEFANLRVVPPGAGICHQVNLEYLAEVVRSDGAAGGAARGGAAAPAGGAGAGGRAPAGPAWLYPDTVIGTDSHTTMINGLGVLGWGVGGIEAEAVMLGQPYFMLVPQVVGVRLAGRLAPGATATDLVLTVTKLLRGVGVVGRFVEYFGPGAEGLTLADRATVANMAPEYGATCGFFPVDGETIAYLRQTGRSDALCARVETYSRAQHLFREPGSADPEYSWVVELDLGDVRPSLAGPRRPQQRVALADMAARFRHDLSTLAGGRDEPIQVKVEFDSDESAGRGSGRELVRDGHVVIASITSCTNTSNPALMLTAGLLARKARDLGLTPKPWVRTSLAPGSRAVTGYLTAAGLLEPLEQLGFGVVGYGCATCIGNSGPLPAGLERAVGDEGLVVAAVLSGNRNFEARIHPAVRANYLASPPLVVAYALAGTVDIDLASEPLGTRPDGRPVYLSDLWPPADEVEEMAACALRPELFRAEYEAALQGTEAWRSMAVPRGALYAWQRDSTYVKEPPFLERFRSEPEPPADIQGARILAILGHSVTTDHISPAGSIARTSPAGRYLIEHGVSPLDFNTYGARRGNHEVLLRGAFANVRLRNAMAEGREGGWTKHHPSREVLSIYEAAMRYQAESAPLVIFAGKEYGTGSSRDWAAKGTALLGVRAVIAESFERIHRSNLVGMGVLPLELPSGCTVEGLGLLGDESVDLEGLSGPLTPAATVRVRIRREDGERRTGQSDLTLECRARLDSSVDVEYYLHGGVLPRVLRLKLGA